MTAQLTGPFTNTAVIRFEVAGGNANSANDLVTIDNLTVTFVNPALNNGSDTLNGGDGDDTYSFTLGDGNDIINELVNDGLLTASRSLCLRSSIRSPASRSSIPSPVFRCGR